MTCSRGEERTIPTNLGPTENGANAFCIAALSLPNQRSGLNSSAITYYLAKHQRVQEKLQQELDEALASEEDEVAPFERVKHLPYLEAVINEALRIHSTAGVGLPRVVPAGGLEVCGKFFPGGTVLSVPGYTLHRDKAVWGDDAQEEL